MIDRVGTVPAPSTLRRAGRRLLAGLALVAASAVTAAGAGAQTTITFDGITGDDGSGVTRVDNCYAEGGLVFTLVGQPCGAADPNTPSPFYSYTPDNGSYTGSRALFNEAFLGTQVRVSGVGGARFSLFSLDLAPIFVFPGAPGTQTVTFTGMRMGGMMLSQTFDLALGGLLQTVQLNGFTDLESVTFDFGNPDAAAQFDNIAAQVVPEPSTYLLLASGLLGVGVMARRRRA